MNLEHVITKSISVNKLVLYLKKYYFIFAVIFFSIIKFLLVNQLPMTMILNSGHDDYLMVSQGNSILKGEWLGPYNNRTLVKGFAHPLFLAVSNKIGLSYNDALILLYMIACIVFCTAMGYVVKKRWVLIFLYIILLFNPVTMNEQSFQRIYRCSLTPAQVLLVFGSYWGLYFAVCRKRKTGISWALLAGISLFFFWNTREDSIWILPFVGTITVVSFITYISKLLKSREMKRWKIVLAVCVFLFPLLFLKFGNLFVSYVNEKHYGIFTINELKDSNFTDVMECLYTIKPEEDIPRVDITREKLLRVYEVSPTLAGIKESIETCMDRWDFSDCTPGDQEVENGWAMWALRDAVQEAGYYKSAVAANNFYEKVARELRDALDEGVFETQRTMPGALMPPWRADCIKDYFHAVFESVFYLVRFTDVNAQNLASEINNRSDFDQYQEFSRLTMSPINVNINIGKKRIKGWAFSKLQDEALSIDIMSDHDVVIKKLELEESNDVAQYAKSMGIEGDSVRVCRFDAEFSTDDDADIYVRFSDNYGHEAFYYEDGTYNGNDEIEYCIDELTAANPYYNYEDSFFEKQIKQVNNVTGAYQKYNCILGIMATFGYLCLIVLFFKWMGAYTEQIWDNCLVLTSLVFSVLVLIAGVSYTHVFGFPSIFSSYYSGAYSLILAYEVLAVYLGSDTLIQYIKTYKYLNKVKGMSKDRQKSMAYEEKRCE